MGAAPHRWGPRLRGSGAGGPVSRGGGAAREARYPGGGAGPGRGGEGGLAAGRSGERLLQPVGRGSRPAPVVSTCPGGEGKPALLPPPERGKFTPVQPRSVRWERAHPVPVRPRPCPLFLAGTPLFLSFPSSLLGR